MQTKTVEQCVRCVSSVFSTSIEGAASDRLSRSTELQHRTAGEANELRSFAYRPAAASFSSPKAQIKRLSDATPSKIVWYKRT